jgi:lipid-A-disaccharide synthase
LKLYVIAGEASGDLHASNLMREMNALQKNIQYRCWGGDLMMEQGANLVKHYRELAFMGFVEVAKNLRTILRNIAFCKEDILAYNPDALILVDYPGFNLRIAEWAKKQNIRVFFYISPTVWAWKENRVDIIKRAVERMYVILPFEKEFYAKHQCEVEFHGHPLLDAIENEKKNFGSKTDFLIENRLDERPLIAVMSGSRHQEIKIMLPVIAKVMDSFPQFQFVIAGAPGQTEAVYAQELEGRNVKILFGKTYELLHHAYAGIIKSGTSTLEMALFRVPQVVVYKGGKISFTIAKWVVQGRVKFISLVNLIFGKEMVRELIQDEMTSEKISEELNRITKDSPYRSAMLNNYNSLIQQLGGSGASARVAASIMDRLRK